MRSLTHHRLLKLSFARFLFCVGVFLLAGVSIRADLRTWTGAEGLQIEATLIGVTGPVATIVRADGVMFDFGADRLSNDDLAYVRDWILQNEGTIGTLSVVAPVWPDRVRV